MNLQDAIKIFGLSGHVTPEIVEKAFRKLAMKYHPDRNPGGLEMMQMVNQAYQELKGWEGYVEGKAGEESSPNEEETATKSSYGDDVMDAINAVKACTGIIIEVCGSWVWLSGNTFAWKDTIKESGFKWASKKKMWYFRPDDWIPKKHRPVDMEKIRARYGSTRVENEERAGLGH